MMMNRPDHSFWSTSEDHNSRRIARRIFLDGLQQKDEQKEKKRRQETYVVILQIFMDVLTVVSLFALPTQPPPTTLVGFWAWVTMILLV
jgi:hypothetical protein